MWDDAGESIVHTVCVSPDATIRQTMQTIDGGGLEIAFVVEGVERRLVGTVSDGDIRRALLAGASLEGTIVCCTNRNCVTLPVNSDRSHALDEMRARGFSQIPIVDDNNCLVGVHLLKEILGTLERPNWAVIMAGGRGERLRPITDHLPKPMIKVAGRPILERLVLHFISYGIRTIYISINYMGGMIKDHFGDGSRFGCSIRYLEESGPLGTAGAISLLPETPAHPILVTNGDLVTDFNVGTILDIHKRQAHSVTVGVREYRHTVPFGVLEMDADRVTLLREKPTLVCYTNAGVYVLDPKLVSRISRDEELTMPDLITSCLERNELVGSFFIQEDWIDVGRPADLRLAAGLM